MVSGDDLPVEHDRVGQGRTVQERKGHLCLLLGLLDRDGLGKEIHAHVQTGSRRLGEIAVEAGVDLELAGAVGPQAAAQEREGDTGLLHTRPVDLALVGGDIDPDR